MAVGDPRRPLIGRAAFGTLMASAIFFVFTATKQIKPVYLHAPWENDPYDTVFSFTMFFVPLVVACFLVQVSLCRKSEALPTSRVVTIVCGCRVAVGGIVIELLSAWVAVAIGANRSQWSGATPGALIGLLSLCTVVTGKVMVDLHRVPRLANSDRAPSASAPSASAPSASAPDWLADVVTVAERESRWLGPLRRPALSMLGWTDRNLVRHVRRHPLAAAAVASGGVPAGGFWRLAICVGYLLPVRLPTPSAGSP